MYIYIYIYFINIYIILSTNIIFLLKIIKYKDFISRLPYALHVLSNFGQGKILFLDTPMENVFIITSNIVLIYFQYMVCLE